MTLTLRAAGFWSLTAASFAWYTWTASGHGYWLDGGEFVAAYATLGISHPPGHPLASLLGHAASMIPLGSLAFRAALLSALCGALAAGLVFLAVDTTLQHVTSTGSSADTETRALHQWARVATAWLATATCALSVGWWLQCVRPEVYALNALLSAVVIERLVASVHARHRQDASAMWLTACYAEGFALSNHHLLALLLAPTALPVFVAVLCRMPEGRRLRTVLASAGAVLTGLLTYATLALRAAAKPSMNLGDPSNWHRFFWVVSAQAFQKNTGDDVPQPLPERFADIGVQLFETFGVAWLMATLLGAYLLLRMRRLRLLGWVWVSTFAVGVTARAWLGFVRSNPDALGYLMPVLAATAACVAVMVGLAAPALSDAVMPRTKPAKTRWLHAAAHVGIGIVLAALLGNAAATAWRAWPSANLREFHATDTMNRARHWSLASETTVIAYNPQTIFQLWGAIAEENARPDVTVVPVPLLTYPGMIDSLVHQAHADQAQLSAVFSPERELDPAHVLALAERTPVSIEMDVRSPAEWIANMAPEGLIYRLHAGGISRADRAAAMKIQERTYAALYRDLGRQLDDYDTRSQLLWLHYTDTLYAMRHHDRDAALGSLRKALQLQPTDETLQGLALRLQATPPSGPLR